jgi:hypothetical protein
MPGVSRGDVGGVQGPPIRRRRAALYLARAALHASA